MSWLSCGGSQVDGKQLWEEDPEVHPKPALCSENRLTHFMSQSGYNTPALIQRIEVPPVSLLCASCSAGGEKCDQEGLDKAKSRGSYEAGSKIKLSQV